MVNFTSGVPQPNQFPSTSQPLMLANNQYLASEGARDHEFTLDSTNTNDGTHKQVTLNNQGSSPGFAGANCVLYSNTVTPAQGSAITEMFFDSGTPYQMTSHVPVKAANGYSCLPGGLLIVWGTVAVVSNNATVLFPNDPNTGMPLKMSAPPYSISGMLLGPNMQGTINYYTATQTGFLVQIAANPGGGSLSTTLLWTAIGPA